MALFQRRPQVSDAIQLYTLGLHKTLLLVGLGNIGKAYDGTRHNIGFDCLNAFVATLGEMGDWVSKRDLKSDISTGQLGDTKVIAIKPTTLMNRSGEAVQAVSHFYRIAPSHTVVIHDELDIPFGQIRMRTGGSAAGHNGVKSVSGSIGEDYGRIRIGIGPKHPESIDSADFVLQAFDKQEAAQLANLRKEVTAILTEYIYSGQLPHETRSFIV